MPSFKKVPDFFESLQIVSDDHVQSIGNGLVFFVVFVVSLSIQEPHWDSVSDWVVNDLQELLLLLSGQFSGSVQTVVGFRF